MKVHYRAFELELLRGGSSTGSRINCGKAQPERRDKSAAKACLTIVLAAWACIGARVQAASVGPAGYTNNFAVRPAATDFATSGGIAGGANDLTTAAALDAAVQNVAASTIGTQVTDASPANPPVKLGSAQWTSGGSAYLMTRPTGNAATLLLAKLVNNTGTNCNVLHFNYQLTVAVSVVEEVPGQRLYYSFSGAAGAWTPLPTASGVNVSSTVNANVLLDQPWANGGTLYLLWADDNSSDGTESAYEIDNFFASAYYTNVPLSLTLTAPASGQHYGFGSAILASVDVTGSPTNVSYYVDGALAAARTTPPFSPVNLASPPLGSHTIYATAQDTSGATVSTITNTFFIDSSLNGTLGANTTLYASNSPYVISGNVTVPANITLTVQPGVTLQFNSGVNLTVSDGGIIMAQGTSNSAIHFTRSGTSGNWGNVTINGSIGSPESRIAYATFDFNISNGNTPAIQVTAGAVCLDHLTFGTPGSPYIHVDGASFIISDCYFPTPTAGFEPCHGTRGVRTDGHGFFIRNFFGKPVMYNDVVDFTGGNRSNPLVHFIDNVLVGGDDDGFDLDGTDAWVEHNIFLHFHRNANTPDSSSGVSGGNNPYSPGDPGGTGTETSEVTVVNNIFFDVDQAMDAKQGNFFTFFNNTVLHQTHVGGIDPIGAVVICADTGTVEGRGFYLEGNVIWDIEQLVRNQTAAVVTYTNNILPLAWSGPGGDNSITDPLFKHVPALAETFFTNWAQAQVMWDWLSLQPNSPAIGTGPNGRDKGAVVPIGASISGAPSGTSGQNNATLIVGINRSGNGIPNAANEFPLGSGYTHYKWRLDGGAWSAETPIANAINLNNLASGPHYVEVTGKRDSGVYQDDPLNGVEAVLSRTPTWVVGADTDGDGMPDDWEIANGFNPNDPSDASLDADGDGMTNLQEYIAGTNPRDASSNLKVTATINGNAVELRFAAAAGKSYTLQSCNGLGTAWLKLADIPAQASPQVIMTPDTRRLRQRFYRVVTPMSP